jgi:nicotinamide-nucleotide amidase
MTDVPADPAQLAEPGPNEPTTTDLVLVHALLRDAGTTVAVAESLTGGLLCAALTDTPGASATMRGGLVVYATDLKAALAGVSAKLLEERGAVDPDVAIALAVGARERLASGYGIGITGVAGPDPQDGKAVGTVFISVAGPSRTVVRQYLLTGPRFEIRHTAVRAALALLVAELSP